MGKGHLAMDASFEERPILLQGSAAPIIIREIENGKDLLCEGCKRSILVKNYLHECFIGIGLQCLCGHITWTPSIPAGEVFPARTLTLGDKGKFLIGSSVINSKDVVLTCDQELGAAAKITAPSTVDIENLELTIENLEKLSYELDILSGGKFNMFLRAAKKAVDRGHTYYRANPLAWAMEFIKRHLNDNTLYMNDATLVALSMIQGYRTIIHKWKTHVYISHIAKEFCDSFHHTLSQFIAASYLSAHGNKIAVNLPSPGIGRSADLYVRLSASEKLFLEVKTPKAVEWPGKVNSRREMKKIVERCLSSARGQIGTRKPGILIIGTTCLASGFVDDFSESIRRVLKSKGFNYSGVAGIAVVGLNNLSLIKTAVTSLNFTAAYSISAIKNVHYFKDNPLRT